MSDDDSIPHIIFCGPTGSNMEAIIQIFMKMLYDDDVEKLCDSVYKVTGSGNTSTDVVIKQSNYHIVIEPNNNNFDRYLIQDVVKEYAKKIPLTVFTSTKTFKTVLINNVDNLSYYAQTSLRRTMEKYSGTCRFIMWCRSLSRVIDPIRSRCYCFKIPAPLDGDILEEILKISYKEGMKLNFSDYNEIIKLANGNIKKALWLLQLKRMGEDYNTSYDDTLNEMVGHIISSKPSALNDIRALLYDSMITNVTGTQIIKDITTLLFANPHVTEYCKLGIAEFAAKYEHNLIRGRREIIHLEAFISSVMFLLFRCNSTKI
jgi:replication factor C subunit 3/5